MPQDKTIKGVMERFDDKYTDEWWLGFCSDYSSNSRGIDSIKQFIQQEIKDALESVVPKRKEPNYQIDGGYKEDEAYNQAIEQINQNIKHYIE